MSEYVLRDLEADDVFPIAEIISKIGIDEFKYCFDSDSVNEIIKNIGNGVDASAAVKTAGISVGLDIAGIILKNMKEIRVELYEFLASLSGMTPEEIKKMKILDFAGMIKDFVKKPEFPDFFKLVASSLK